MSARHYRPKSFDRAIERGDIPEDSEWGCDGCGAANAANAETCSRCDDEWEEWIERCRMGVL